jgi:hypothetical protein
MCLSLELCAPLFIKEIAYLLSQNTFIGLLGIPKLNCQQKIKLNPDQITYHCAACNVLSSIVNSATQPCFLLKPRNNYSTK